MSATPLLQVDDLQLEIPVQGRTLHAIRGVSLSLHAGQTLGLVGESGSGKSLTALSIMGLHPANATRRAQRMQLGGDDLLAMNDTQLARQIRGQRMAMIFQEPMTCLNPVMTVERQLCEALTQHGLASYEAARERALALLERVGIPQAKSRITQYPHQFSGGQRQRIMIAMALMAKPQVLIADEPTTALDVTVQAEILSLLTELRNETGMALILVSHNLGVISRVSDQVAVMYAGKIVEQAAVSDLFSQPQHPYTQGLLACIPDAAQAPGSRLGSIQGVVPSLIGQVKACAFAARCPHANETCRTQQPDWHVDSAGHGVSCWRWQEISQPARVTYADAEAAASSQADHSHVLLRATQLKKVYAVSKGMFAAKTDLVAVDGVDLTIERGQTLAIVGESGCGKSTLARLLLGLEQSDGGQLETEGGQDVWNQPMARARLIQPVFQDPMGSLNPRRTIKDSIRLPLEIHGIGTAQEREAKVLEVMKQVGLSERLHQAYPAQLSGGQRQRVAIARALVLEPKILLCDEPTSALDVSVQAQILNLLMDLRQSRQLALVLITHDLSVVRHIADRVAVMYLGKVMETGPASEVFEAPQHPYTKALLASALPVEAGAGIPPAQIKLASTQAEALRTACRFAPRCPSVQSACDAAPPLQARGLSASACHFALTQHKAIST